MGHTMKITSSNYSEAGVCELLAGWAVENMASAELNVDAYDALVERGGMSRAGVRVTHRNATNLGAVWQAVSQISGDIAKMPLELYTRTGDGGQGPATKHPAFYRVKHQPNPEMTAVKFWKRVMQHVLLWGNAYIWVQWAANSVPKAIVPLLPDRTFPERSDGTLYYVTDVNGESRKLDMWSVMHIEGIADYEGLRGLDPTIEAREAWGLALARMGFASRFFRNGGRVGGILELPASQPKPIRDKVEAGFRRVYEDSDEAFRTVVLRDNAKFHAAQHTFGDTQLVESSREGTRDIARWFNIKPSRLGEEGGQSYNSKAEDNRDYLDTTLSPWMAQIRAECERVLLTEPQRRLEQYWFRYDTKTLLQMSQLDRYRGYEIGLRSEFMSPNEVREAEGMSRREGGDDFGNPNINPKQPSPAPPNPEPNPQPTEPNPDAMVALLNATSRQCIKDVAWRRAACKGSPRTEWAERQTASVRDTLLPAVAAYTSVFGGSADEIASSLSNRLVVQYLADADAAGAMPALDRLDLSKIVHDSLSAGGASTANVPVA